ncbi:hypothetical protein PR048_002365 [Dryococelus australis]|uniref:DDE-1 domain-containing protein n=1 Tax=Dryococelus australis TaxID=614101 RepID=A0ABQ9IK08_9NEOP|nr:hypothetical protein PR048_002365 [Dryococelus australis]
MVTKLFLKVFEHFITYSSPFEKNPVLLIFDNHISHFPFMPLIRSAHFTVDGLYLPLPHLTVRSTRYRSVVPVNPEKIRSEAGGMYAGRKREYSEKTFNRTAWPVVLPT